MFKNFIATLLISVPLLCGAAEKVNINTADREALISVQGIGPSRADAIIADRKQNGAYLSIEDLTRIRGIGNALIEANREQLTVE